LPCALLMNGGGMMFRAKRRTQHVLEKEVLRAVHRCCFSFAHIMVRNRRDATDVRRSGRQAAYRRYLLAHSDAYAFTQADAPRRRLVVRPPRASRTAAAPGAGTL